MPKGEDITTRYKIDISELKENITEATKNIKLANAEFKAASSGMDDWTKSSDGLNAKLKQLNSVLVEENKKLDSYKSQLQEVEKAETENGKRSDILKEKLQQLSSQGVSKTSEEYKKYEKALSEVEQEQVANSKVVDKLRVTILNQQATVNKTEKEIRQYTKTLSEIEDRSKEATKSSGQAARGLNNVGEAAQKAEKNSDSLASKLGGGLKKGLMGIATVAVGAVAGFLSVGTATQDTIEDMGKLEAAFKSAGYSTETAQKSYKGMVGILGETDQSVEAVNHLARLTKNEQELSKWTDIATGIYATFGDSLPLEGLTEAANETAKVGQVTGPLADALNWAGISEDEFNNKLAKCNSEQERATLITTTLSETYQDAANVYKEVNGDLIASREATANMSTAMSEMGRVAMPITTALKQGFANLVITMIPRTRTNRRWC
ncbi:MAG: hypothetical protein HFJ51_00585 [Clostridia bacterium]|nr:hypothetical protein [Clostridia bacterium]